MRLWVNPEAETFHCWHCGFGGRSLAVLMVSGSEGQRRYLRHLGERPMSARQAVAAPPCTSLPDGFIPFRLNGSRCEAPYLTYLHTRNITDHTVALYRMGYVDSGRLAGRVVVPSFDGAGSINFWSARSIDPTEAVRYRLPYSSKDVVSNEHMIDWTSPVYLVEGIFDEVAIGPQAISLYGKFMLPALATRLVSARPPLVNVCLDDDAEDDAWVLIARLLSYDLPCAMVRLDDKDPAVAGSDVVARAAAAAPPVTGRMSMMEARL